MPTPTSATNITQQFDAGEMQPRHDDATIGWGDLIDRLCDGGTFWLTTSSNDGRPHTRPVFAVVAHDAVHVASSVTATKTRSLARSAPTSVAVNTPGLDVVWSGTPRRVTDDGEIAVVADAYRTAYGWNVTIDTSANALAAPYGAPTAGPPTYHVFSIDPETVHAVATDTPFAGRSTRWDFTQPTHSSDAHELLNSSGFRAVFTVE